MLEQISPLWDVYLEHKKHDLPLVLATLVKTIGSSYKKAGAMMLIEADRTTHGLISGGCLEADVAEHAMAVFDTGLATSIKYDLSDESIFGLGAGCDGRIEIVLQRIVDDYLPFSALNPSAEQAETVSLMIQSCQVGTYPIGSYYLQKKDQILESEKDFFASNRSAVDEINYHPAPKIAVCGAGIDVQPLLEILHILHWHVYLIDHRSGRLNHELYDQQTQLIEVKIADLEPTLKPHQFDAAVIMTHNLDRDAAYLKYFSSTYTPWLGLLGPIKRRDKVLDKADIKFQQIENRLHAPIGLDLGGHMPENIAVSIAAQLQQHFHTLKPPQQT